MTHPTEAGERERLAETLEAFCHTADYDGGPICRERGEKNPCICCEAASLLRTEPSGEAILTHEDVREWADRLEQYAAYMEQTEVADVDGRWLRNRVIDLQGVADELRLLSRPTTPVEPEDAKLSKVWRDALETAACCADRRGAEDVAGAVRRLIEVSEDSSAPVEEREPE